MSVSLSVFYKSHEKLCQFHSYFVIFMEEKNDYPVIIMLVSLYSIGNQFHFFQIT